MKRSVVILLHLGFWFCYCLLVAIILAVYYRNPINGVNQTARIMNALKTLFVFAFIPSLISYLLYYFVVFPKYFQQKKYLLSLLSGFLISLGAAVVTYILLRYFIETGRLNDMDKSGRNGRSTAGQVILVMTFIGMICGIVALVINGFITWLNEIKLKEALTEKNHEMEMALVKLQLDPHLLFNTINNIDALILKDATTASEYLNKLSDIMRFILYETRADTIPLAKEVEYIDKYIALQKIRTANENYVKLTVHGNTAGRNIAPMIFIPFIENAFKHASNKKIENAIAVTIFIKDDTVQLLCENKFEVKHNGHPAVGGLGNELIEKRLNLIYAGKHRLEVCKTDDLYSINLTIPNG